MSKFNLGDSLILDTDYSTSEKKTGATWIDGKPIYRKCFSVAPTTALTLPINVGFDDTNVETYTQMYAIRYWSTSTKQCNIVPYYASASDTMHIARDGIGLSIKGAGTIYGYVLVAEYTKTTD